MRQLLEDSNDRIGLEGQKVQEIKGKEKNKNNIWKKMPPPRSM
jgi:hypothetical protein